MRGPLTAALWHTPWQSWTFPSHHSPTREQRESMLETRKGLCSYKRKTICYQSHQYIFTVKDNSWSLTNRVMKKIAGMDWQKTATNILNKYCMLLKMPGHRGITLKKTLSLTRYLTHVAQTIPSRSCVYRVAVNTAGFCSDINGHFLRLYFVVWDWINTTLTVFPKHLLVTTALLCCCS